MHIKERTITAPTKKIVVLELHGNLIREKNNPQLLRNWIQRVQEAHAVKIDIVLNMKGVREFDTPRRSALVSIHHKVHNRGNQVFFVQIPDHIMEIISQKLDKVFIVYDDERRLLRNLRRQKR